MGCNVLGRFAGLPAKEGRYRLATTRDELVRPGARLAEGKTKIIFAGPDDETVYMVHKDAITAGDGAKRDVLADKGELSCRTTSAVFAYLDRQGAGSRTSHDAARLRGPGASMGAAGYSARRFEDRVRPDRAGACRGGRRRQRFLASLAGRCARADAGQAGLPQSGAIHTGGAGGYTAPVRRGGGASRTVPHRERRA